MKKYSINQSIVLGLVLTFSQASISGIKSEMAPTRELVASFEKTLGSLKISKDNVSLYVSIGDGDDQFVIKDLNGQKPLIPASISKVATTSAILDQFPAGYKFKTQLLSNGKIEKGILKGSLILKGGGDPSFVSENMWFLVNQLLRHQLTEIEGDLVVDDSFFDSSRFDQSRQSVRVDRAYDAPVGAMSFNWNSVNIFVKPGAKGEKAQVYLDPENEYLQLINTTKTIAGSGNELIAERKDGSKNGSDIIHVSGAIGEKSKEIVVYKNITSPDLWAGYNLKSFLSQRGIKVSGKIKNGSTPTDANILAEYESKNIEFILADMNKFSNNYVAEMLTKNMSAKNSPPGNLADGVKIISEHLKKLLIPEDQFYIENPSGLTRKNKFSSYAMWKILLHLRNDFTVQPEFLNSLPIAGVDGTLKKRMKSGPAERWVRAKTGYIDGVVSLAGYAGRRDGRVVTFSFIYNGSEDEGKVRSSFDSLLETLVK